MDEETQVEETLIPEETDVEIVEEDETEETVEEVKSKLAKAEELAKNYKIRAEKAEKKSEKTEIKPKTQEISPIDVYALMQANVAQEDIPEVQDYAKMKGISLADALKTDVVKTILADATEKRKTAEATNTGTARRSNSKTTDEGLLNAARKGQMPESDDDINRLINARLGVK